MPKKKVRPERDRRARQAERLGRLMHLLRLISGRGRWKMADLAAELECSERTIYRLLDALTACGVPWYFDKQQETYRIREGFRLGNLVDATSQSQSQTQESPEKAIAIVNEARCLIEQLKSFVARLEAVINQSSST